jgi:hypothetical protein
MILIIILKVNKNKAPEAPPPAPADPQLLGDCAAAESGRALVRYLFTDGAGGAAAGLASARGGFVPVDYGKPAFISQPPRVSLWSSNALHQRQ